MRRPSRQGLLPVCAFGTSASLAGFLIICSMLLAIPRAGYTQDVSSLLSDYFSKAGNVDLPAPALEILTNTPHETTFPLLEPYLNDTTNAIRSMACEIVHRIGMLTSAREARKAAVELLLRTYTTRNSEVNGNILAYLKSYSREDFSAAARDSTRALVRNPPLHFDQILKLAGFLELRDLTSEIRPLAQPGNPATIRWAAYLSLARMGDSFAVTSIYERIRNTNVNDDVVYGILPDLIYTRQKPLYSYIVEALYLKENNCMSADAEREMPIPCGYRIMELLAPVIDGFPFTLAPGGDLNVPDYAVALENVRAWFQTNKTYNILNDTY